MSAEVETSKGYRPVVPYPQRLTAGQKNKYYTEIQEIFKQVKINFPLLDVIQQVLLYAKFLKDLCIVKRKLNVTKKVFLTEHVSALILSETPQKLRDLDSPHIFIMIVLQQVTVVDRSVKVSRGIIEDVGVLQLTFMNTTLEMDAFNACKMLSGCDDLEVHAIDMVYDFDVSELLLVFDSEIAFEDDFPKQSKAIVETNPFWRRPVFEALGLPEVMKSSEDEVLTLDLKPLLEDLKYIFLGQVEGTFL
ncbi:hypothetical protein F2P56_014865, partial [Juglans regia]